MFDPMLISCFVGVAVILAVGGAGLVLGSSGASAAEQRLEGMSGGFRAARADPRAGILLRPETLDMAGASAWIRMLPNLENLGRLYEQADVSWPLNRFLAVAGGLAATGGLIPLAFGVSPLFVPVGAAVLGAIPFLWLVRRKNARIRKFIEKMPEAVELISRALRAGHGLASGLKLASEELKGPIADEFGRVFEEQNLGIPIEVSLRGMADRIPVMDVRFFVIAVIIQRSTGGDLAEVLDKIGKLIRQRFELHGHVKALTAEGRLSGIVLLALPPGLLGFLAATNWNYVGPLFTTTFGKRMLIITAVLQVFGAWVIKKIVSIKV